MAGGGRTEHHPGRKHEFQIHSQVGFMEELGADRHAIQRFDGYHGVLREGPET
jgi:hypothetical protein